MHAKVQFLIKIGGTQMDKTFVRGSILGFATATVLFAGGIEINKAITPSEDFVVAKALVAEENGIHNENDIRLYRYTDDEIWTKLTDISQFGEKNGKGLYPHYVYTSCAKNSEERVLEIVFAGTDLDKMYETEFCGKPLTYYEQMGDLSITYETDRSKPVYVARVNVSHIGWSRLDRITEAIDKEV